MKIRGENLTKAAKMLLALGEESAASVLKHLKNEEIESLTAEIVRIGKIDPDEKKSLLADLKKSTIEKEWLNEGGTRTAREFLEAAFGAEGAAYYLEKLENRELNGSFRAFENFSAEKLTIVLEDQMPAIISGILSHLNPKFAAAVLSGLKPETRSKTAITMAKSQKLHPEALKAARNALLKKLETIEDDPSDEINGENQLTEILKHLDQGGEKRILDSINDSEPDMARRIQDRLFDFDELKQLSSAEIRILMQEIPQLDVWARALRGAGIDLLRHLLGSVSLNRSADIQAEMERIGPLPLKEIEENRRFVMRMVEQLEKNGKMVLRKDREQFVE